MGNEFIPVYKTVMFLGEINSRKTDIINDFLSRVNTRIKTINENSVRIHVGDYTKLTIV